MQILVTGATGFLGNNIVRSLLEQGHRVTATVRLSSDPRPLDGLDVETQVVDLNDPSEVSQSLEDVDAVIHSAARIHIGWQQLDSSRISNVETTRQLAVAARRKGIRMVYVSTVDTLAAATAISAVDETQTDPIKQHSAYIVSKREAEQVVLEECTRGLDGVIVNPGFMIGPWDWKPSSGKMMLMLWKQPVLFYAPGGGCSVVDVRDVAQGVISAMEKGACGQRYILGGENQSYLDLWKLMAQVMGRRPPVRAMRSPLAKVVGKVGDLLSWGIGRELDVNSAAIQMGQTFNYSSSEKAKRELDYQIHSVEQALQDAWAWFREHGYA